MRKGKIPALILHTTQVDIRWGTISCQSGIVIEHKHIRGVLNIIFYVGFKKTVKQGNIRTNVQHLGGFPLGVAVAESGYAVSGVGRALCTSLIICGRRWVSYIRQEEGRVV